MKRVKLLKRHLSVANVLSCIALFVALSGAAYAATAVTKNSVKAKSIAKGAVTTPKLRNGAVTNAKLANGAVTGAKIAPATIGSSQLANGAVRSGQLGGGVVTEGKLKNGAVTEAKLLNGAVTNSKLGANAVSAGKIQDGAVTSAKLATSLYTQLVKNASYVTVASASNTVEATKTATASCPAGKQVVGGGARVVGGDQPIAITESTPTAVTAEGKRTGWTASATQVAVTAVNWSVEVSAICAEF
jgi:trimeric autotransporter adhesin